MDGVDAYVSESGTAVARLLAVEKEQQAKFNGQSRRQKNKSNRNSQCKNGCTRLMQKLEGGATEQAAAVPLASHYMLSSSFAVVTTRHPLFLPPPRGYCFDIDSQVDSDEI